MGPQWLKCCADPGGGDAPGGMANDSEEEEEEEEEHQTVEDACAPDQILSTTALHPHFGAEVKLQGGRTLADDGVASAVASALSRHGLLLFRQCP